MAKPTPSAADFVVDGNHQKPSRSQESGCFEELIKGYALSENPNGTRNSSIIGVPVIFGGANVNAPYPKIYIGLDDVFSFDNESAGDTQPKYGTKVGSLRGLASIATSLTNQVFPGDANNNDYNYAFNRGEITTFGTDQFVLPQIETALNVSAVGDDVMIDASGADDTAPTSNWERGVRFTPSTLTPGARVFIASKGHTGASNCEWAISYDDTNIYRTIGGTDAIVGSTSLMTAGVECRMAIINHGDTGFFGKGVFDSFAFNDTMLRDEATDNRGSVTSSRNEVIGGILASDSDVAATVSNAIGYYRHYVRYNKDRMAVPDEIPDFQISSYANYKTAVLFALGEGDSIMNGFRSGSDPDSLIRSKSFLFLLESYYLSLGYDVLFANFGTSGSALEQKAPTDIPYPAHVNDLVTFNSNPGNVTRWCKRWKIDLLLTNSGTNEYAGDTAPELPFNWSAYLCAIKMCDATAARYGVKMLHNTNELSSFFAPDPDEYKKYRAEEVRRLMYMQSNSFFDWSGRVTDPSTKRGYGYSMKDQAHPCDHWIIAETLKPYITGFIYNLRASLPGYGGKLYPN